LLAGEFRAEPGARIAAAQFLQRTGRQRAVAIRGPVECVVMEQNRHAVVGQLDVDLDPCGAQFMGPHHRGERVLRRVAGGAAMPDDRWRFRV